ncbi:phosphoribosylformylglycinamidine synthase subunit PurL [bacterium]|nr:phosphoribosylformylglycinamidine synthase subunit PurL [bacterium]|tara:strand:+ start:6864 stop:9050 length:2187 start_codon:yes stop_codon:yes gene_type:complete
MSLSQSDCNQLTQLLGRVPTEVEACVVDVMWSEHCSYKSTRPLLKRFPVRAPSVVVGVGEDAGIVAFAEHNGRQYGLAVSHESHNHPSQILPIEGAATGVGGVVRDVYCMGADVIGVLNSLHFGQGTWHTEHIANQVVQGVGDYANPLGVPVLAGETVYHPSYNENCLVNVAAVGLVPLDHIIHSYVPEAAKTEPYDLILLGKSTDATGFGGATFSSVTLDQSDSATNIGAVQVHDPFLKRVVVNVLNAIWAYVRDADIAVGCKDLGAGGIACATSEITSASGFGARVILDQVNQSVPNLDPKVIACSETQERFCLAVPRSHSAAILAIANETYAMGDTYPNAGAVVIGEVVQAPRYVVESKGQVVCDLPISIITTDVLVERTSANRAVAFGEFDVAPVHTVDTVAALVQHVIAHEAARPKAYVYRRFDHGVRGDTIVSPGEAGAGVVAPIPGCLDAVAVSIDSNHYGVLNSYQSGAAAVAEAVRNVIAVGGDPVALTDCLNYGNPENPDVFFDIQQGIQGIADAATALGGSDPLPVISGNVSLYNESKTGSSVCPSPVVLALGKMADFRQSVTMVFKAVGSTVVWVGKAQAQFGGTVIADVLPDANFSAVPEVDFALEKQQNDWCLAAIQSRRVLSCHDIATGGLIVTLLDMVRGAGGTGTIGCSVTVPEATLFTDCFSESGGYVLEVPSDSVAGLLSTAGSVPVRILGETVAQPLISVNKKTVYSQ